MNSFHDQWDVQEGVTYLNHGSFGPAPAVVRRVQQRWRSAMDRQPMQYFARDYEAAWYASRLALAGFVGARPHRLALVDNATTAMNVVARVMPLSEGDEVLGTDHEYGAVRRIWSQACRQSGAIWREVCLPASIEGDEQLVRAFERSITPRTRIVVVSHITSPTALLLPIESIVALARARDIAVCIDGPHAVAQVDLRLDELQCDFYCASCHKWLCAPFGSGFLYVADRWAERVRPPIQSWGRLDPVQPENWSDEFVWLGTRDATAQLCLPEAIEFLEQTVGMAAFREYSRKLARYAAERLRETVCPESPLSLEPAMYLGMAHAPLPAGGALALQTALQKRFKIETPVIEFGQRRWIRVSCHLYNTQEQVDYLCSSLSALLREGL